jgi:hypothetical protein
MVSIELTGNLSMQSVLDAHALFGAILNPDDFTNVNQLYAKLQLRGSLTLKNATLTLPVDDQKVFFAFHKLNLINSKIVLNSSNTTIVCNEYEHEKSQIISFLGNNQVAISGNDGNTSGENGHAGNNGLDAATCVMFVTDKVKTIGGPMSIDLTGQSGGKGGNGKAGGKGAQGARGRNCSSGTIDCRSGCGNGHRGERGGKGGDGGNGGDGGDGGKFEFRFHGYNTPSDYFFAFISNGGKGGYKGFGAAGGEGGEGGRAGASGCTWCDGRCYSGPAGEVGLKGADGFNGADGEKKHLINSNFDMNYIKSYLTLWNGEKLTKDLVFEFESGISKATN